VEDWNRETIFTGNVGLYSTAETYFASKEIEIGEKKLKIRAILLHRSRSFKVIEVGTNPKPVYDFPLVINSN